MDDSLCLCRVVNSAVDGQFDGGERRRATVPLDASLNEVVFLESAEETPSTGDIDAVTHSHTQVTAVGRYQPSGEEVTPH